MSKVWDSEQLCYVNTHTVEVKTEVIEEVKEVKSQVPNDTWTKTNIVKWCKANKIDEINSGDTKSDLLDKIADACEE